MPPPAHTPVAPPREPPGPAELPTELLHLVESLSLRLDDVSQFQLPQLSRCDGPVQQHEQLVVGLRNELNAIKREVEELKLQVDDLDRARDRRAGLQHVQHIQQAFDAVSKQYRAAVLASKKLMDQARPMTGREQLFASTNTKNGYHHPSQAMQPKPPMMGQGRAAGDQSADDALMSATSDVTEGLRRTLQLMQTEVDRSVLTNEALEQQTSTLKMTNESYSTLSSLLNVSKALITSLEKADLLDRLILLAALVFFGLCCAYVLKRRVLDKGLRLAGLMGQVVGRTKSISGKVVQSVVPGGAEKLEGWLPFGAGGEGEGVVSMVAQVVDKVAPVVDKLAGLVKRQGREVATTVMTTLMALAVQVQQFVMAKMNRVPVAVDDDEEEEEEEEHASLVNKILSKDDKETQTTEPVQTTKEEVEPQTEQWVSKEESPTIVVEQADEPKKAVSVPLSEMEAEKKEEEEEVKQLEPEKVVVPQEAEEQEDDDDDEYEEEEGIFTKPVESEVVNADVALDIEPQVEEAKDVPVSDNTEALLEEEVTPVEEETSIKQDIDERAQVPTSEVEEPLVQDDKVNDTAPITEAPEPVQPVLEETTPVDAPVEAYDVSPAIKVELEQPLDQGLPDVDATLITDAVEEVQVPVEEEEVVDGPIHVIEPVPFEETATMASEYPPAQEPVPDSTNEDTAHVEATPTPPPETVLEKATEVEENVEGDATAPAQAEIKVETSLPIETGTPGVDTPSEETMDDAFDLPGGSGTFGQDVMGAYENSTEAAIPEPEIEVAAKVSEQVDVKEAAEPTSVDVGTQTDVLEKEKTEEETPSQIVVIPALEPVLETVEGVPSAEEEEVDSSPEKIFDPLAHQPPHRPTQYAQDAQQQIEDNVVGSNAPEPEEVALPENEDKDDLLNFNFDDDADLEALLALPMTTPTTTSDGPIAAEPVPAEAAVPVVEAEEEVQTPAAPEPEALPFEDVKVDEAGLQPEETAPVEEQEDASEGAEQDVVHAPTTTTEEAEPAEPAPAAIVAEETLVAKDEEDAEKVKDEL